MNNNYFYPIFSDWSEDELRQVCKLYTLVEMAYENNNGIAANKILSAFANFQKINPAKGEQKQLERQFFKRSGYDIYKTVQQAKQAHQNVKMMK